MSTLLQQLSVPKIQFLDTTVSPNETKTITADRPVKVSIRDPRRFSQNEALGGRVETVGLWVSRVDIDVEWSFVAADPDIYPGSSVLGPYYLFRRLWLSCWDGTPFTLWIHKDLEYGYPNDLYQPHWTHKNRYQVRFHQDMKELPLEDQEGIKDRHQIVLKMQEVIS